MRRLALIGWVLALGGCNALRDTFAGRQQTVGTAAGQTLTVEHLAKLIGHASRIPVRPDVFTGLASVYLDYAVFATALGHGRDLHDSTLVLAAEWPLVSQIRWERYHEQLIATRGQLTTAQMDSAFTAGSMRLFQHILIRVPASARTNFLDSLYMDSLARDRRLEIVSGAPARVRAVVPQIVAARTDERALATYRGGGAFRVKDLARWLLALDPNDVRGITTATDAQLTQLVRVLAQREILLDEVAKAGVQLAARDWEQVRAEHDSSVARLERLLDLSPEMLKDSGATTAARVHVAMAHLDRYTEQAITQGTSPFVPVPPFLAAALREGQDWTLNPAGVARAVEGAQAIRAADSTATGHGPSSAPPGLRRASGPPPVPARSE